MKAPLVLVISILLLGSCHQTPQPAAADISAVPIPPLHLSGRSYTFGPQMDTANCKAIAACDCCETNILFTDEHQFIAIFLCLFDNTYAHGRYRIEGDKVYLAFEGQKVNEITNITVHADTIATHGDTTLSETEYKVAAMPHSIDTLSAFMCGGIVGFKSHNIDYGMPDSAGAMKPSLDNLHSILERMKYK